ncbi:MAG: DUF3307 domain-containing protein [Anaplasmataceae bacterium]|nr:DUF3307 domain-containing protein [Anaplasmataceae bacterium]
MTHLTIFEVLVLCHLVGDWLCQTEFEAMNKAKGRFLNFAIIKHCFTYTLSFIPAYLYFGFPAWWLGVIYITHHLLDRRWPVIWFIRTMKCTDQRTIDALFWLVIAVDQIFHLLVLVGLIFTF